MCGSWVVVGLGEGVGGRAVGSALLSAAVAAALGAGMKHVPLLLLATVLLALALALHLTMMPFFWQRHGASDLWGGG